MSVTLQRRTHGGVGRALGCTPTQECRRVYRVHRPLHRTLRRYQSLRCLPQPCLRCNSPRRLFLPMFLSVSCYYLQVFVVFSRYCLCFVVTSHPLYDCVVVATPIVYPMVYDDPNGRWWMANQCSYLYHAIISNELIKVRSVSPSQ